MRARVTREQIIGFRLAGHRLDHPEDDRGGNSGGDSRGGPAILDAAGRCGAQNSPPGSAVLALAARVPGLTRDAFTRAVGAERSLLQTWSLRGAPYVFPHTDAALFTAGVLPPTEAAARRFLPGVVPALDELGLTLGEATDLLEAEIDAVLRGRALDVHELGRELAPRLEAGLSAGQLRHWRSEGPHAAGQPIGEAVVHFLLRLLCLRGRICLAPREEDRARFVLVTEHLGAPLPAVDPADARANLLRRYLHAYGPATRADAAAWIGVGSREAAAWWDLLAEELAPVDTDAGKRWALSADLPALAGARLPAGVRVLPPGDPYLRSPDRALLLDPAGQRALWGNVGGPGAVLIDGELRATWRPRTRVGRLTVTVTGLSALSAGDRSRVETVAAGLGPLRGAEHTEVRFGKG